MLRISIHSQEPALLFVLEGRLVGAWATELLRISQQLAWDTPPVIDLNAVTYVDLKGENVLRLLHRRGSHFLTETAYGQELCRQLGLRNAPPEQIEDVRTLSVGCHRLHTC